MVRRKVVTPIVTTKNVKSVREIHPTVMPPDLTRLTEIIVPEIVRTVIKPGICKNYTRRRGIGLIAAIKAETDRIILRINIIPLVC